MRNRTISGLLHALSLSSLVAAGAIRVADAAVSVPPNPDVWCGFYTVPNNPNVYCGGVCPFAGDVCTWTTNLRTGINTCNCSPEIIDDSVN